MDVEHTRARIRALSPAATLERGYAIVHRDDSHIVRHPDDVTSGDKVRIAVAGGEFAAQVVPNSQ